MLSLVMESDRVVHNNVEVRARLMMSGSRDRWYCAALSVRRRALGRRARTGKLRAECSAEFAGDARCRYLRPLRPLAARPARPELSLRNATTNISLFHL